MRGRRLRLGLLLGALLALVGASRGPAGAPVTVRWLGVAGFSIAAGDAVVLHDPYFSRPGLWRTLFRRYRPDPAVLEPLVSPGSPAPELASARLVLIGHSHFDHLGDAPWLATRTGAVVAGSETTLQIARGYGVEQARTRRADPGDRFRTGPFTVRVFESRHAPVLLGRVPLEGTLEEPPDAPIHALSFVLGDARGYLVVHEPSGARIFLLSSAGLHAPALEPLAGEPRIDLLLAPTQGRDADYARELVTRLRPRVVIPHHFDDFFRPLDHAEAAAPRDPDDLAAFAQELREAAAALGVRVDVRSLGLFEAVTLPDLEAVGGDP